MVSMYLHVASFRQLVDCSFTGTLSILYLISDRIIATPQYEYEAAAGRMFNA